MGSWLLRKQIIAAILLILPIAGFLQAENAPVENPLSLVNGYYPAYPPTAQATGDQQALIQRGEYLAKMGDCISCHTNVKAKTPAYAGGLPIETPFGTFYSPNITPDKKTGIGTWSEKDFIRALREGRDPQGRNYFPVFPYLYFTQITDEDAHALYAYFMNLPAVHLANKAVPFPFNLPGARTTLWGWNVLFFFPQAQQFHEHKHQSPEWNRGKYIVDGLGHCGMCHTPLNPLGAPKTKFYLTGGLIDGYWAPNITQYGLASATHEQVANVLKLNQLINQAGPVAGPMAEVNHNSMMYLTDADRMAIATYLKTVVSEEPYALVPSNKPPSLSRGQQVYFTACVLCHQDGVMTAPLIGNAAGWYERLKTSGLTGLYRNAIYGYNFMPVKGACVTCSDNDIISAVDYLLDESLTRTELSHIKSSGLIKRPVSGETVYTQQCAVCHDNGNQGAPKIGDKKTWQPLITKNIDVLIEHTIDGKNHLKNGGCRQCSTYEVIQAIKYMVNKSATKGNYSLW